MKIKDIPGCSVVFGRPMHRLVKPTASSMAATSSSPASSDANGRQQPTPTLTRALKPAAINSGYIDLSNVEEAPFYSTPPEDSFTREGDVLLKLSAPFSAALVGKEEAGLFIPSSCAAIRLDQTGRENFDPGYIAGYINLPLINESLRSQASGSKVLILNSMQIAEIDISQIPLARQQRVARIFAAAIVNRKLRRELDDVESRLVEAEFAQAFQGGE